jgi:hypothetical protein
VAGPIPDRFVVWLADLDPAGTLRTGVLVEVVRGTTTAEILVYPGAEPAAELAAYVSQHHARVSPGCPSELRLFNRQQAGRHLRSRGYKSGDVIVTDDAGPQLAALADHWQAGGPTKHGGRADWSLVLAGCGYSKEGRYRRYRNEPAVRLTNLGSATTATWSRGRLEPGRLAPKVGPIVDILNVGAALCGQPCSFKELLRAFDLDPPDPAEGSEITRLRDRAHSVIELWQRLVAELNLLGYRVDPAWLTSTGTLAAVMWRDAGLPALAGRFQLPDRLQGAGASAFYGGWFHANLVHTPLPAVLADLSSAYPRVFRLSGLQRYLIAATMEPGDVADQIRQLVGATDLSAQILDPGLWRQLGITLVQVRPRGELLPVKLPGRSTVGSLDLGGDGVWYHWPDVAAAAIRSGRPPEIVEAVHLDPHGVIPGLKAVRLPGGPEVRLDRDDLVSALIEQRQRIEADPQLSPPQRARRVRMVKLLASSCCYGLLSRTDRVHTRSGVRDRCIAPDGSVLMAGDGGVIERPGPYCWLPAAGAVCAGTRLIVAATIADLKAAT